MRYRLRTLLIVLALGPPVLAAVWVKYSARREAERQRAARERLQRELRTPQPQLIFTSSSLETPAVRPPVPDSQ